MNILQNPLFSFEEILSLEPNERLQKLFMVLDDLPFHDYQTTLRRGPKGYSSKLMLRTLLAMKTYSIPTVVLLIERLNSDFKFRYSCCFSLSGRIPSEATFSRFLARLAENESLYQLFLSVIEKGRQLGIIDSEILVIDSTAIDSYEKKCPKKELNQDGTKADWGSAGYRMVYWGAGKFRCPHILGKVDCPFGSNWCSSSNYGHTVKTKVKDDPRRFSNPHRNSRNWTQLYHKRTAVERINGRLKDHLGLEIFKVQGINKVFVHMLLSNICLVSGTIAANLNGCRKSVA